MSNGEATRLITRLLPAALALCLLLPLTIGALSALIIRGGVDGIIDVLFDPYIQKVAIFTVFQAVLSTSLSVVIAIPMARAFHRRRFWGRNLLLRLFSVTLVMPVIVAILGIVIIYGKSGWISHVLSWFHIETGHYLYGLTGILIAHVFFNMPLVTRSLLNALDAIPPESWRLASQFGMRGFDIFKLIEWPAMRAVLPGIAGVVLMLCFTSFAVVLTLGGGPKATTIEVAIYQALRFDFDIPSAVALCFVQIILCGSIAVMLLRIGRPAEMFDTEKTTFLRPDTDHSFGKITDMILLGLAVLFVVPPMLAIIAKGLNMDGLNILKDAKLWQAVGYSILIATSSGALSLLLGTGLLLTSRSLRLRYNKYISSQALDLGGSLILIMPPFVMATGLFLILKDHMNVFAIGPYLVIFTNAAMALPFVIRVLGPALHQSGDSHDRLCQNLKIEGLNRLRLVEWPIVRKPAALALGISMTLSFGDLGVVALFGSQNFSTLPLYIYRLTGGYKLDQAASASLLLVFLCFGLFWFTEKFVGGRNA